MLKLHRLLPGNRMSWLWWPEFEKRVLEFHDRYGSEMTPAQRQQFTDELRQRFAGTPQLSGYWLVLNGKDALDQQAVGHLCAWINILYGKPYVLCYQTELDVRWEGREVLLEIMTQTAAWIAELNTQLAAKNEPLIDYVEDYTIKSVEAWKRWLPELDIVKVMTVMRIRIPGREASESKHPVQ